MSTSNRKLIDQLFILSLFVIPNLTYFGISEHYGLGRSVFNLDYLLCILAYALGRKALFIPVFIATVALDWVYMSAPLYHFAPVDFLRQTFSLRLLHADGAVMPLGAALSIAIVLTAGIWLAMCRPGGGSWKSYFPVGLLATFVVFLDAANGSFHFEPTEHLFHRDLLAADQNFAASPLWKSVNTEFFGIQARNDGAGHHDGHLTPESALQAAIDHIDPAAYDNVYFVLVESWGKFADPTLDDVVVRPLFRHGLEQDYLVHRGSVPFKGSTTSAEMRELCNHVGVYRDMTEQKKKACIPSTFRSRGFQTVATHGFSGSMFDRKEWWPTLGFDRTVFATDFRALNYSRQCGSTFRGVCDADQIKMVSNLIAAAKNPIFAYTLTLNSHLPVAPATIEEAHFERPSRVDDTVYSLMASWRLVFEALGAAADRLNQRRTLFVMVGDHTPPLWNRESAALFTRDRVPFIILQPRPPGAVVGTSAFCCQP